MRHICKPGKRNGSIEPAPYDSRYLDLTQSQVVNMQDVQRVSQNDMAMDVYRQSNEVPSYSHLAHQDAMRNDLVPQQGRGYYVEPGAVASSNHQVTVDHHGEALAATMNRSAQTGNPHGRSSTEYSKAQPMILLSERSLGDPRVLLTNGKALQARVNSTSKPAMISSQDLASTLASDIADRLGLSSGKESPYKTKEDVERAIQNSVTNLLGLGSNSTQREITSDSPARDSAATEKLFKCEFCTKKKKTQCDLTKHRKRHTRPYGCTHTSCPRRFGSKNDWKRHENAMHWQIEAWKCAEKREKPAHTPAHYAHNPAHAKIQNKKRHQCGQVFYRREQFQAHLDTDHGCKDGEYVRLQCKLRRIGRNGQKGFWCGFCQTVVELKKRGLEAWDERFTHIDEEHFKKGERVESWFPMDKELPKGILDEEKKDTDSEPGRGTDQEASGSDAEDDDDHYSTNGPRAKSDNRPGHSKAKSTDTASQPQASQTKTMELMWFCCQCGDGPKSRKMNKSCFGGSCQHKVCRNCRSHYPQEATLLGGSTV